MKIIPRLINLITSLHSYFYGTNTGTLPQKLSLPFSLYFSPPRDCVIIRFFVAVHMDENRWLNSNSLRNLKIAATKSKHNCDTPSQGRGKLLFLSPRGGKVSRINIYTNYIAGGRFLICPLCVRILITKPSVVSFTAITV